MLIHWLNNVQLLFSLKHSEASHWVVRGVLREKGAPVTTLAGEGGALEKGKGAPPPVSGPEGPPEGLNPGFVRTHKTGEGKDLNE